MSPSDPATQTIRPRWFRRVLILALLAVLGLLIKFVLHLLLPRNVTASGEMLSLPLAGGPFQIPYFCGVKEPKGIVILGTGDGGWSYWEENTAKHLSGLGYAVGGWDCRKFADSRQYDQAALSRGFVEAVEAVRRRAKEGDWDWEGDGDSLPVWYGGWSTGAEQSVAAAAGPERPPRLAGLLLAAPGGRGRYGITASDLLGGTPTGPGTFALADLAPALKGVRVAQFVAGLDPMDDVDWVRKLPAPALMIPLPGKLHDMGNAGPDFLKKVDEAMAWTLQADSPAP